MERVASCTSFVSSRSQKLFRRFFEWFGRSLYLHYCKYLGLGLLLTILCSTAGLMYFMLACDANGGTVQCDENRSFYLWIPRRSAVWEHYQEIIDVFGSYPSIMSMLLKTTDSTQDSILLPSNLDAAFTIFSSIDNVSLRFEGTTYDFDDLCLRSAPTNPICDSTANNFFATMFGGDEARWSNVSDIEDAINGESAATSFFLGGLEYDEEDATPFIVGAQSMRILYELEGSTNETIQEIVYEYMGEWQTYWREHRAKYSKEDGIDIAYYSDRSFDDEISRVLLGDIPIFILALLIMLMYLMFTLGKVSCIGARPWLAFSAIWVMLCALAVGFSISICTGTTFNTIVMLVPYILLGVGVDDMIILVDTYDQTPMPDDDILNASHRLANALKSSGLSITLTSLCSSMAFFVGSATDIPGISSFCVYAAWSFLANFVLQFLLFVPLLVMDDKRIRNKKNFCCPCCVSHAGKLHNKSQIAFFDPEKVVKNNGAMSTTKFKPDSTINVDAKKKSLRDAVKCVEKCHVENLLQLTLIPMMRRRMCRIFVIILFVLICGASIYVTPLLNTESDATRLIPDDSYLLDYFEQVNEIYTGRFLDELEIVIKDQDFSDAQVRTNILEMIGDMKSQQDAFDTTNNWLEGFVLWLNATNIDIDNLESAAFYEQLKKYSNTSSSWNSEIVYDDYDAPSLVQHTRFTMPVTKEAKISKQYAEYLEWNAILQKYLSPQHGYAYVPEYAFAYLTNTIMRLTVLNMLFAGIGVFCILAIFLDLRLSLFILCIVAMIDIDLFGWMWLFGVSLDTLSYTQCVMAVGLTVDYVIHITHAIVDAKVPLDPNHQLDSYNKIYNQKLKIALSEMGTSVSKGAFTTFLGAVSLMFSQSEAFRIFFKMFSGIIIIAVAHGMILVPALLGQMRFMYGGIQQQNEKTSPETKQEAAIVAMHHLSLGKSEQHSNASDYATKDGGGEPFGTGSNNPMKKDLSPIVSTGTGVDVGVDGKHQSAGKRTPVDDKRSSIKMTNFQDEDSDDPFDEY